jgi:rare lipoprotein A
MKQEYESRTGRSAAAVTHPSSRRTPGSTRPANRRIPAFVLHAGAEPTDRQTAAPAPDCDATLIRGIAVHSHQFWPLDRIAAWLLICLLGAVAAGLTAYDLSAAKAASKAAAAAAANAALVSTAPPVQPPSAPPLSPSGKPMPDLSGDKRTGIASFYARMFTGRVMADGTRMDPNDDNAASRTLPLGTVAKVTNLETGRSAVVTIQDRGPYVKGRIVDLSPSTAQAIGLAPAAGLAKVEVAPIAVPMPDGSVRRGEAAR